MRFSRFSLALSLAVITACSAEAGPAGPAGPQGPQGVAGPQGPAGPAAPAGLTRLTFSGTLSSSGFATHTLPSQVTFVPPPTMSCYVQSPTTPTVWLQIADGMSTSSGSSATCAVQRSSTTGVVAASLLMPTTFAGWSYAIVVVY